LNPLEQSEILDIYRNSRTIAVVGASTNPTKPGNSIPAYLQSQGFRIIPVNPAGGEILGEPAVPSLQAMGESVDVVNVFRPSAETPDIARAAVEIGAKVLWLQAGIESVEASQIASEAGLAVVMNTCMGAAHKKLRTEGLL
jgi:predicted CoA-binding protein